MSLTVEQERALLPGRTRAVEQQEPVAGARLFQQFCIFTPVLWVFGVLTLSAVLLTLRLAWARWPRGWAIKFIGVEGEMLPGHEGQVTQDFLCANAPVFGARNAQEFHKQIGLVARMRRIRRRSTPRRR